MSLPEGTVTFLLTDVEGSTAAWERAPEAMAIALPRSLELVEHAVAEHGGHLPIEQGEGDSRLAAFTRAADAVRAAVAVQAAMAREAWPAGAALRVRVALHAGDARLRDERTYGGTVVHRAARLRSLATGGQVLVSRAVHDLVVDARVPGVELVDLGAHRLRDLSRPEQVFLLRHPDMPAVEEGLRSLSAVPNNLPHSVATFVGRVDELSEIGALLAGHRLVTLTGPGGCGKTRLALEASADAAPRTPDGVWLAELSPLADPELLPDAILAAIGVSDAPGVDSLDRAAEHLRDRTALLVFDTCEHLVDAVASAAHRLLETCPRLTVLATSREPLGVTGEAVWRVPPLALGEGREDAVELFVERAREARPSFDATAAAPTLARICQRLDGIPLAIELAAARVRSLSADRILAGLDDRFRLLVGGSRTALPRQQTLEASVEWSHDLLDDDERRVLRRLSIFAGSFDIDAAERVVAFDGVDTVTVFDTVSRLVDKSLVQVDERTTGQLRYSLLDTLRAYGRDRLAEASEAELTRDRHLLFIRGLAESAVPGLTRAESGVLDRLDDHLDDIRVALDWACSQPGRDGDALAIVGALAFWWSLRGRAREGQSWCERALDAAPPDASAPRLWARWARAHVAYYGGDVLTALNEAASLAADAAEAGDATLESRALTLSGGTFEFMDPAGARAALDRAVEQAEAGGDEWTIADAHQLRAFSHLFQGGWEPMERDFAQARPTAERWDHAYLLGWDLVGRAWRALATGVLREAEMTAREGQRVARRLGVGSVDGCATLLLVTALTERGLTDDALTLAREGKAHLARHAGIFADELVAIAQGRTHLARGELPDAIAQLGAGLTALRSVGVNVLCDQASAWLAAAHRGTGDLASARRHAEEGLELARLIGDALGEAESSLELARVAAAEGQRKTAEESCHVALVKAVEADARPLIVRALEELASQAVTAEAAVEAARLLGAARRARTAMGLVPYADEQVALEATTGAIAEALDDLDWAAALEEGAALDLGDAVAYARRARGERGRPSHGWESLTPTQLKVVELVAQGLTNPQIGERLFVGRGTVKTHLAAIFAKLGVATRAELAAAASRRGLGEAGR